MKKVLVFLVLVFCFAWVDKVAHFGIAYMSHDILQGTMKNFVTEDVVLTHDRLPTQNISANDYCNDVSLVLVNFAGLAKELIIDGKLDPSDLAFNALGSGLSWIINK